MLSKSFNLTNSTMKQDKLLRNLYLTQPWKQHYVRNVSSIARILQVNNHNKNPYLYHYRASTRKRSIWFSEIIKTFRGDRGFICYVTNYYWGQVYPFSGYSA